MSALDRYAPPGRLVSVGGSRVHVVESGAGRPTVVLESGMGGNVLDLDARDGGPPGLDPRHRV